MCSTKSHLVGRVRWLTVSSGAALLRLHPQARAGAGTGAGALGPGVSAREADEDGEADALEEAELPPHADDGADDEQEHATHRRGHVERREQVERREEHDGGGAQQRGDDREVRTLQDAVARVPPCPQGGGNSSVGRRPLTNLP